MTRIAGDHIIITPCCGRRYTTTAYASINLMAQEYWTDGYSHQGLAPRHDGLRHCSCGRFFLLSQAQQVGFIPGSRRTHTAPKVVWLREHAQERAQERSNRSLRALFGLPPDDSANTSPNTSSAGRDTGAGYGPDEFDEEPEPAPFVIDAQLHEVIAASTHNPEIQCTARRRLWRTLNEPYRAVYRKHRSNGAKDFPAYLPTEEQRHNMRALLGVLPQQEEDSSLEQAELLRELGDADGARQMLGPVDHNSPLVGRVILGCLNQGLSGPVRYKVW